MESVGKARQKSQPVFRERAKGRGLPNWPLPCLTYNRRGMKTELEKPCLWHLHLVPYHPSLESRIVGNKEGRTVPM